MVVDVDVDFVVIIVLNVDVVDLKVLVMEVKFGWVVGWCMTFPPPENSRFKLCWVVVIFVR